MQCVSSEWSVLRSSYHNMLIYSAHILCSGIIYEWGAYKGYGGDGASAIVGRLFDCIMAVALGSNMVRYCAFEQLDIT